MVESDTGKMLLIVSVAYLIPVVLFLAGYLVMFAVPGAGTALRYAVGILGFFAGILIAVAYDRRLRRQGGVSFQIVRLF